jgi:hypothetical protein
MSINFKLELNRVDRFKAGSNDVDDPNYENGEIVFRLPSMVFHLNEYRYWRRAFDARNGGDYMGEKEITVDKAIDVISDFLIQYTAHTAAIIALKALSEFKDRANEVQVIVSWA